VQHNVVEWVVQAAQSASPASVSTPTPATASAEQVTRSPPRTGCSAGVSAAAAAVLALLKRNNAVLHKTASLAAKLNAKEAKSQRALYLQQLHAIAGGDADNSAGATSADSAATTLFLEGLHSATLEAAVEACKQVGALSGGTGTFRLLPGTSFKHYGVVFAGEFCVYHILTLILLARSPFKLHWTCCGWCVCDLPLGLWEMSFICFMSARREPGGRARVRCRGGGRAESVPHLGRPALRCEHY
jgi:hypothetical protein